ncbi:hypothetical protein Avbf_18049 [Armadillidium vulgare]|nr:hypothetical protein Avbf_18049 [Armadillidium vulgare]
MNLMKLTLSSIILFNRRRSGEAERILICHYEKGLQASSSCPDLQKTLSPSEQMMSKYFKRIEIPGKRGNKNLRDFIGVNPDNKFLFPRPNNDSVNSISGSKTLQDIVKMADLKKPETMLSTNLRKHIATMSQVLNLSQPELEELCKLMGHDIRVHTSYYRLPDDAVQLGKLTKLLIAAQNGDILKYRNKTIEEIELNPEEFISEDEKDEEDENDVDVDDNDEEDSNYYTSLHGKSRIKRTSNPTSDLIFSSLQKKKL